MMLNCAGHKAQVCRMADYYVPIQIRREKHVKMTSDELEDQWTTN